MGLDYSRHSAQASGELKLAKLRQLQSGEINISKHSPPSTVLQVEADGDDPQIGYKALPQKSWCVPSPSACWATESFSKLCCTVAPHILMSHDPLQSIANMHHSTLLCLSWDLANAFIVHELYMLLHH